MTSVCVCVCVCVRVCAWYLLDLAGLDLAGMGRSGTAWAVSSWEILDVLENFGAGIDLDRAVPGTLEGCAPDGGGGTRAFAFAQTFIRRYACKQFAMPQQSGMPGGAPSAWSSKPRSSVWAAFSRKNWECSLYRHATARPNPAGLACDFSDVGFRRSAAYQTCHTTCGPAG